MASDRPPLYAYELAREFISLHGPDAATYLQGQCSQDVDALGVGACADALLLEPNGKLTALVRVLRTGSEQFVVDVDVGFGAVVMARLQRFKLRTKVEIEALDWTCLARRGSELTTEVAVVGSDDSTFHLPVDWNGWRGVDQVGNHHGLPADIPTVDQASWEMWRIESGVPMMGRELDDRTVPAEANLLERAVSFTKGCYTGQELVGRLDARGNKVPRRLMGLVATKGQISVGDELEMAGATSLVTSAAQSKSLEASIGLAYVHRTVDTGSTVTLSGGKEAVVRELPLVEA